MADERVDDSSPSLFERITTAILSALAMLGTAILGPLVAAGHAHGAGRNFYVIYHGFYIWASVLALMAFTSGFVLGPKRMASMFGYLWGTEQPPNKRLTWALQGGVVIVVLISWWVAGGRL